MAKRSLWADSMLNKSVVPDRPQPPIKMGASENSLASRDFPRRVINGKKGFFQAFSMVEG
jgi:hypothetical protein